MEIVLEAEAEDMQKIDDGFEITCDPATFPDVRGKLDEFKLKLDEAKVTMLPKVTVAVTGKDVPKVLRLIDNLEEHDDVQDVYHNYEISDEEMEKAAEAE